MRIRTATIVRLRDALLQSGRRPSVVVSPAYEALARAGMLSQEEATAVSRVEPLAETLFLMMAADGKVNEPERDAVRGAIRGLSDNLLRTGTINVMLESFALHLLQQGRDARLREIADVLAESPAEAEGAFGLAAAVALADDEVADEENELINQLAEWFGIPPERATRILDQLEEDRNTAE